MNLSTEAERATLRVLMQHWNSLNVELFQGALKPPALELWRKGAQLGRWHPQSRTLRLSLDLVCTASWSQVIEVLKHEMAHQFMTEVLGRVHEPPHGDAFRRLCASRGIDPTAAGMPPAGDAADPAAGTALRRVQRLLALAESSNVHEAQAAMNAAQRLMLKYNLAAVGASSGASYGARCLGAPTGRVPAHHKVLAGVLTSHFFVEAVWVHAWDVRRQRYGRVLEIMGAQHNLDLAEYAHGFVLDTSDRLWVEHKTARGIQSNQLRRRYLTGVVMGFSDRLKQQAREHASQGLVWVGDADLGRFVDRRHPSLHAGRRTLITADAAWADGRAAGREMVLHRPIHERGQAGGLLEG